MILDSLKNHPIYTGISPLLSKAFNFLTENPIKDKKVGDYQIMGDEIFVKIREYDTKTKDDSVWESHRDYIDLHYVIKGSEYIGYSFLKNMQKKEYIPKKDQFVLEGLGDFFKLDKGFFSLFFPHDAHMPAVHLYKIKTVKKAIIKISIKNFYRRS